MRTIPPRYRRRTLLATVGAAALAVGSLVVAAPAHAATPGPCVNYASGGTPCVAAHSTTRALFGTYTGPLYQVRRSSDNTYLSISPLSAGGVANAAAQDSFCSGTTCVISRIYDQTSRHNDLTQAPGGGASCTRRRPPMC